MPIKWYQFGPLLSHVRHYDKSNRLMCFSRLLGGHHPLLYGPHRPHLLGHCQDSAGLAAQLPTKSVRMIYIDDDIQPHLYQRKICRAHLDHGTRVKNLFECRSSQWNSRMRRKGRTNETWTLSPVSKSLLTRCYISPSYARLHMYTGFTFCVETSPIKHCDQHSSNTLLCDALKRDKLPCRDGARMVCENAFNSVRINAVKCSCTICFVTLIRL